MKKISDLRPGVQGKIKKIEGPSNLRKKLLDMGIIPGSPFEVVKLAPLGDPIDVKIKGYHLSLRKAEAATVLVEVEDT
ncbi:MAG TPA: ferrous iron transport protein A [Candidatus Omnitrophota bacterium]|nr:ferrous iron transport protein A [Candidatus Omnitrophota bacterium]